MQPPSPTATPRGTFVPDVRSCVAPPRHSILMFPALLLAASLHAAPDSLAIARLADSLAAARMRDSVTGLVIGVYHRGRPVLRRAWGTGDSAFTRPLAVDGTLPIGSVTKQLVAVAVLRLVDEGKLALDAPASRWLPRLGGAAKDVTVRQLLNQRSGLPRYEMLALARGAGVTRDAVVAIIDSLPRQFAPGTRFEYNNANYYLLGAIIAAVTGKAWDAYLGDAFLRPLGMTATRRCAGVDDAGLAGFVRMTTTSPRARGRPVPAVAIEAAGALCSSIDDMARWSAALHGGRLLTPASYRAMVTPPDSTNPYAMGSVAQPVGGHRRFWHNGAITSGFSAQLAHYPDDSLTIVVLAPTFPARPEEVEVTLGRAALGIPAPAPRPAPAVASTGSAAPALAAFAGTYRTGPLTFVVRQQGESLELLDPAQRTIPLARSGPLRLCSTADASFCLNFEAPDGKPAVLMVDSPRAKAPPARRVE